MKYLLAAVAILAAQPAHADAFRDRQTAFQALSAIDAAQTCYALETGRGREMNPILGSKPSCPKVIAFKLGATVLHEVIAREIDKHDPDAARVFQIASIVIQGGVVAANFRIVF